MKLQVTNKQSDKTRLGKTFVRYFISALSRTCHLFSKCDLSCHCRGCVSGPPDCSATCQVPSTRGAGFWYCDGFNKSVDQVNNTLIIFRGDFATFCIQSQAMSNFERCYYMCGDKPLQMVTCLAGDWDQDVDSDPHRFACPIRWEYGSTNTHTGSSLN